jgi:hypothetical protein
MRFAYIDSQGNEVSIPSVDALALRIELGAIGPGTDLYDAQSDRWGPAESHEIYHTLARDVGGEDFLVPSPPPPEPLDASSPEDDRDGPPTPDVSEPGPSAVRTSEAGPPAPSPAEPPPATAEELGLTLAPADPTEEAGDDLVDSVEAQDDEVWDPEDLAPVEEDELDSARDSMADDDALAEEPLEFGVQLDGADFEHDEEALDLEPVLDFGGGQEDDAGGGLDLEPPMSEFDPSAPPNWMEHEGPPTDDGEPMLDLSEDVEDLEADSEDGEPSEEAPEVMRPEPSPRPTRPPPRRPQPRRSLTKPLVAVLLLGAVGYAGWYGWQQYGPQLVPPPSRPEVVLPEIPAELEAPMREIAGTALVRMFQRIEDRAFPEGTPEAPHEDWLAGVYLGNASQFPGVADFWTGVSGFADRLSSEGAAAFHDAYVILADSSDVPAEAVPVIVERADSGFLATQEDRIRTYELLDALARASLALHEFLVTNETEIRYTPAQGLAGNPVEEAVPATEEMGDQMWSLVEEITNALDRLGTLDRVSRERLNAVVLERIRETGIR